MSNDSSEGSAAAVVPAVAPAGNDDPASTKGSAEAAESSPSGGGGPASSVRKSAARRPAKKAAAKKSSSGANARKKAQVKSAPPGSSGATAKFPRHAVEQALRIPEAIYKQNGGKPASQKDAVEYAGGTTVSGPWRLEISSAKKYGFLESQGALLGITERARRAIAPQSDGDRLGALREAILAAPEMSEVYNFYRGENLPDQQFLINTLTDRFGIPSDKVGEFLDVFTTSLESAKLIDTSGERARLLDVGRDESHKGPQARKAAAVSAAEGASCFVMQPFAEPLGGYYETIYRPAIQQAGMTAVRADAEIFGTGKIIDQIWRGINAATVLIAELTSKNPNVFYELGLAHALEKPVILVSSNQDDVPFDLRHIRVILYDQADPFWGAKLIDKIADNIRSAIENPEDAIFNLEAAVRS